MMDKIEACTKWLKANGRARKLGKHQRVIQQRKHASEDSLIHRLMRRQMISFEGSVPVIMRAGCIN